MDPLSIVASLIAVGQAGDRLLSLIAQTRRYLKAPEEIDALEAELQRLKMVIGIVDAFALTQLSEHVPSIKRILSDCKRIIDALETILTECKRGYSSQKQLGQVRMVRLGWLKRRSRVESYKQQLRDAMASLILVITIAKP